MKETLKKKWAELSPARKKKAVIFAAVLIVLLFGLLGHRYRKPAKPAAASRDADKTISLDNGILKKSEYMDVQKQLSDFKNQLKEQNAAIVNGARVQSDMREKKSVRVQPPIPKYFPPPFSNGVSSANVRSGTPGSSFNFPPPQFKGDLKNVKNEKISDDEKVIGGIEVVAGNTTSRDNGNDNSKGNAGKKKDTVYLPTSFMEATLLSGLDAPTSDDAKEGDVPVLLRINAPAVLPNDVKAELKGCFVIAEGHGNLADERAHMRLVTLSCIAKNGRAVIDQKVKGFVVDQDGKVGLRGRVVSKMGAALARSFIAGFFGGLGQATQAETMTTSISALGTTQTVQPSRILETGAGSGVAQAAHQLQKFYLDLAKQSMPVVEVGATRKVTLVISEGVTLRIKNFCNRMGDDDRCEN